MNYIWYFLIVVSIIFGAINGTLDDVAKAIFTGTELSVKIILTLLGIMTFWLGIMKIAEKSGIVEFISKLLKPKLTLTIALLAQILTKLKAPILCLVYLRQTQKNSLINITKLKR